ncbi:MAG: hypothetical protein ACTS85_00735 [Arsenophonus sp. NC-PG7-MAG3]
MDKVKILLGNSGDKFNQDVEWLLVTKKQFADKPVEILFLLEYHVNN